MLIALGCSAIYSNQHVYNALDQSEDVEDMIDIRSL
jgi:hypothetical protein